MSDATRPRSRTAIRSIALVALTLVTAVAAVAWAPASAAAATAPTQTYTQGVAGSPFTLVSPLSPLVTLSGDTDQRLQLTTGITRQIDATTPGYAASNPRDPRSVQALPDGDILIADRTNNLVADIRPNGSAKWSYSYTGTSKPWPFFAQLLANGNYLITYRTACKVVEVTPDKRIVWSYGRPPSPIDSPPDSSLGQLADPFSATRVVMNGVEATLICDNKSTNRVIAVRDSDYDPTKPNDGYTAASIIWQYGLGDSGGDGPGQLNSPRTAQLLSNGNVLICNSQTQNPELRGSNRIMEVRAGDYDASKPNLGYTAASIVWQYAGGGSAGTINDPNQAVGLADQDVLIADTGNDRVLEVNRQGTVTFRFDGVKEPRGVSRSPLDGRILIADNGNHRIIAVGAATSASTQSVPLDLAPAGKLKEFLGLHWNASVFAPGVSLFVQYSIDGGTWLPAVGLGGIDLPLLTVGTTIAYRPTFGSSDPRYTPLLDDITVRYRAYAGPSGGSGGGGATGHHASSNGGSGTDTYGPSTSGGGGGGSGGGAGGGTGSGGGSGSGSGGSGNGNGSAGSPTGSRSHASTSGQGATSPLTLPADTAPSAGNAVQHVAGIVIGSGGQRSGGEGGGRSRATWERLLVAGAIAAVIAAAIVAPGLVVGRRRRHLVAFDHVNPRRLPSTRIPLLED